MHMAAFLLALGPPGRVLGTEEYGCATTDHLSWKLEWVALFALILPFLCPLSSAADFQIWETIPAPAHSPPCVPRPPGVHPRQGQTETEWSCGRGRLWPVWCEILKCQGTAGEMTDKFVIKLFTKERPLVVLAFSCSSPKKTFFVFQTQH